MINSTYLSGGPWSQLQLYTRSNGGNEGVEVRYRYLELHAS
jgi:hypothetical protein